MSEKKSKAINFLKRNAYYFVFVVCLAVLSIITVALVVSANNRQVNGDNPVVENPNDNAGIINPPDDDPTDKPTDNPNNNPSQSPDDKPVVSVIVFDMPVSGSSIIKEYVSAGVIYNQTLGLYSGHKAIDFGAEEGTQVKCVYDGVVESITTSKLEGITVTINHGNDLKTVYNSIEIAEGLEQGKSVLKGDVIGSVSTNNRKEYKDGPHLHFEVLENGEKIDPYKYLVTEEK